MMANSAWGRISNSVMTFVVGTVGLNFQGADVLTVRGRKSGELRSLVVNPLEIDGETYLMSARGESSWVRNMRAAGEGQLRRGRRVRSFTAHELDNEEKLPFMRAYLQKWGWQVKSFMGVDGKSSDDDIRAILPKHPVFRLTFGHDQSR
jgi:deazaflavin-dependent oxidoreductase (nitroreductase family)